MKRNIFKHICQGTLLAAVALCTVSCEDELDSELFTKYSYLMDNGWQENIEMPINDDNTVDLPVYFGVNGTSGNDKDIIVKLDVDADTLSLFNFDKFKNETASYYDLLPAGCYTFDKPQYTIPKGDLNAKAVCHIDLATLRQHNIYNEYVLPVKIASSEGEVVGPSRYTKALYYLNFTNKYSGVYAGNGTIKQLGTSYSAEVAGKQLYAISKDECYMYAGNMDRTKTGHKQYVITAKFNDDGTLDVTANNEAIALVPLKGNWQQKFYTNVSDSRKLIRMVTVTIGYEYSDLDNAEDNVRYSYEGTLTKSEDVFKKDYPNAKVEVED